MVYVFSRGSVSVYPTLHRKLDLLLPKRGWREGSVTGGLEKKQSVSCKSTVPSLGTICILSRYPRDAASLPPPEQGVSGCTQAYEIRQGCDAARGLDPADWTNIQFLSAIPYPRAASINEEEQGLYPKVTAHW